MRYRIRFIKDWRQFKAGEVNDELAYGVMDMHVMCGRAVWVTDDGKGMEAPPHDKAIKARRTAKAVG